MLSIRFDYKNLLIFSIQYTDSLYIQVYLTFILKKELQDMETQLFIS